MIIIRPAVAPRRVVEQRVRRLNRFADQIAIQLPDEEQRGRGLVEDRLVHVGPVPAARPARTVFFAVVVEARRIHERLAVGGRQPVRAAASRTYPFRPREVPDAEREQFISSRAKFIGGPLTLRSSRAR